MGIRQIADTCPVQFIKYHRGIQALINISIHPRDYKTVVHIYGGLPGSGKSSLARKLYPSAYWKSPTMDFWEGYNCEEVVIIDDHNKPWFPWAILMQLMDRYPLTVNVKGSSCAFIAKTIIITTNVPPDEWYTPPEKGTNPYPIDAMRRRVDDCLYFNGSPDLEPASVSFDTLCYNLRQINSNS